MKRCISAILVIAMAFTALIACNQNSQSSSYVMQTLKSNGYLNEFDDKNDTHGDLILRVISVASDGLTTYVRIAYDGQFPQGNENLPSEELQEDAIFLENNNGGAVPDYTQAVNKNIKEVKLCTNNVEWNFAHQFTLGYTGEDFPVVRPILPDETLADNEAILIFYGTELSGTANVSLEFEVYGCDEKFIINDLRCEIAPVKIRDFEANDLIFNAPLATMKLVSTKSSLLETIVTVEWDLDPNFSHSLHFFSGQQIVFDWGDASNGTFMFYPTISSLQKNENVVMIRSHSIQGSIPVEKEIKIYALDTLSQTKTADMFIIPSE